MIPQIELKYAIGSSNAKVRTALKGCVCLIEFDLYVHHSSSHDELAHNVGAKWSDRVVDGNFSIVDGVIITRWKSINYCVDNDDFLLSDEFYQQQVIIAVNNKLIFSKCEEILKLAFL